jgi:hypothetical protein
MRRVARWHRHLSTVASLGLAAGRAVAGAPQLTIDWSVNGGHTTHVVPAAFPAGGGAYAYEGTSTDPGTGLVLQYDLTGNPASQLFGNVKILNALASTITVSVKVSLPFDPKYPGGTLLSGIVVVGMTTGTGGGMLNSLAPALFHTLIDGGDAGPFVTLFWDPFLMSSTGMGNSSAYSDYGIPNPVPGPPLLNAFGCALDFQLTSGDLASISPYLTVEGDAEFCSADINGDGTVTTQDFYLLISSWGPCGAPCPADITGDGVVDVNDLIILLSLWGPC